MNTKKRILTSLNIFILIMFFFNIPLVFANPYEDFTTYTRIDPNNHITRTVSRVTVTGLLRNEVAYIYNDKGVDYFGDFSHWIDIYLDDMTGANKAQWVVWSLFNGLGSRVGSGNGINIFFEEQGGIPKLTLEARDGVGYPNDKYDVSYDTLYYLVIERVSADITCKIYSDSGRTSLLDTLTVTQDSADTYRYIYATQTTGASGVGATDGYCENLDLAPIILVYVTFYNNSGGILRVNNATIINGTEISYDNETIIELIAIVEGNLTYGFNNFTWNSNYNISNPLLLIIPSNLTIWCYFGSISELLDLTIPIALIVSLGVICLLLVIAKIKR